MNILTDIDFSAGKSFAVICAVAAVACIDVFRRVRNRPTHIFFATVLGSALSLGLIQTAEQFLQPGLQDNPYAMALAVVLAVLGWRFLFGPWGVQTKLVMLGTFLFWICLNMFSDLEASDRSARLIAAVTALIPALIWCMLFLKYHRERISTVCLLFMAGMLSTVPILFYDTLVRRGIELEFFFFHLKPLNFNQAAENFVTGHMSGGSELETALFATLLSFLFVGLIEESSKYWVVSRSAKQLFSSIDDVMQLSIIVAIGFAFAENIINPVYFTAFVREYLLHGSAPDFGGFVGNVLGRSVLTSMVHIVSTGVMGYFMGLAIFAGPILQERHARGRAYSWFCLLHGMLRLREVSIYRVHMMAAGLLSAVFLHGFFNFIVTLPEILPGNPENLSDLFGDGAPAFLNVFPLLMIPAVLYVVGGFWLLTWLFMRKANIVEHGHLIMKEEVVPVLPQEG